ncbi:hypothetical protein NQ314_001157 [Rhamnusium bicolor]|uniref:Uncharacterized protein n=1 Tax=Rhamnusium bicolor TaxID=1586634 RepID=A0AAV8ZSR9_9CUCU|nr:hypothetical protein NQ314_001157 [Rhamnusium bicolor]
MSSQPCEKTFRATRSLTSTFSTMFFQRQKQSGDDRNENNTPLPNFDEIQSIINGVIPEVEEKCRELGMDMSGEDLWMHITVPNINDLDGLENEDIVLEKEVNKSMENTVSGEGSSNQDKDISEEVSEPEIDLEDLKDIDLIDYSSKSRNNSPYVKVISRNKEIMVKKSTLCWVLENKNGRLSSDRLERVKGPKSFTKTGPKHNSVKNKAIMRKTLTTSVKTVGKKAKKKVERIKKSRKKYFDSDSESSSSFSSPTYDDTEDTEDDIFDNLVHMSDENTKSNEYSIEVPELEKYYTVAYEGAYYVGRVIEIINNKKSKIKFLKSDLERLVWPATEDIQIVDNTFIFYGPLTLDGCGPFYLRGSTKTIIDSKYKIFKKKYFKST